MTGECDCCANRAACKKDIGIIFGFCRTDFVPTSPTVGAIHESPAEQNDR